MNSSSLSLFNILSGDAVVSTTDAALGQSAEGQPLFSLPMDLQGEALNACPWGFTKGDGLTLMETALDPDDESGLALVNWAGMMLPLSTLPSDPAIPQADATATGAGTATLNLQLGAANLLRTDLKLQVAPEGADSMPALFSLPTGASALSAEGAAQSILGDFTGQAFTLGPSLPAAKLGSDENLSIANLSTLLANGDGASSAVQQLEQQLQDMNGPDPKLDLSSSPQTERPQQLADAVWAHLDWMSDKSISRASIELHPEDLGHIEIDMQLDGKSARVEFVAASAETRHLLESSVPRLREMFAQQGLTLADTGVRDGNAQSGSDQPQRGFASPSREPSSLSEPTQTISTVRRLHAGGLSEYA